MLVVNRTKIRNSLSDTIHALAKTQESNRNPSPEGLPPVFGEVIAYIPLVHAVFISCKDHVPSLQDEESAEEVRSILEHCKNKATRLDDIFQNVIGRPDAKEHYRTVAQGDRFEVLMKEILQNMIKLARTPPFIEVVGSKIEKLEEALRKVNAVPCSLPEAPPSSDNFHNTGAGFINANTGNGTQNNNNGGGFQFNGDVHGLGFSRNGSGRQ